MPPLLFLPMLYFYLCFLMLQGLDIDQMALPRKLLLVVKLSKFHLKLALDSVLAQVMALARKDALGEKLVLT